MDGSGLIAFHERMLDGGLAAPAFGGLAILAALAAVGIGRASAFSTHSHLAVPRIIAVPAAAPPPAARASTEAHQPAATDGLRRFGGLVGNDLSESLRRAGVPDAAARDYVAQLLRVPGFASQISVADRFDLVVADFAGEGEVLVYAGMDRVGRGDLMFLKYGDGKGRVEWVDARGLERSGSEGLELPVSGRVTSGFGSRLHPLLGYVRFHRGLDLAAAMGTPIHAAADGRVVSAGWHGGYGRQVALVHGGGLATSYGHMSRIAAHPGEMVRRGEVIGFAGSSGLSTGPHVHFEVTRNGLAIDPRSARIDMPVAMSKEQRAAFNGELRTVLTIAAPARSGT